MTISIKILFKMIRTQKAQEFTTKTNIPNETQAINTSETQVASKYYSK